MGMVINTNIAALNAQRHLGLISKKLATAMERLSSGLRINKAKDDAAGLAISDGMRADIRALSQGVRNANDGIGVIQTAEGGLNEISSILTRMKELAMEAASGTLSDTDRGYAHNEFNALKNELDRISNGTTFNGDALLDGTYTAKNIHIGLNNTQGTDKISISIESGTASEGFGQTSLGLAATSISTQTKAQTAIATMENAFGEVLEARSKLGALQSRFEHMVSNINNIIENTTAAESQIRDADIAKEVTEFTKYQILQQSGIAMLGQANVTPQAVLSLLR